jgi:transglutaminase-like putative cysteine protease
VKPFIFLVVSAALAAIACASNDGANSDARIATNGSTGTPAAVKPGGRARHFTLQYEATVPAAPEKSKEVDLWLPVAGESEFQKVKMTGVTAPASHEINVEPTLGNKIFHVKVPAASLPLTVTIDYDVERTERRTDLSAAPNGASLSTDARAEFLASTKLVPVGTEVLKLSGFQPKGGDELGLARQVYDHVFAKMKYDKPKEVPGWGRGSTEWACEKGFGNCSDFHAYFMSLARTEKLPARFSMGLPLPTDKHEGEIAGYHCWAEFFVDGRGWVPVDISEASKAAGKSPEMVDYYFGGLTPDRVELSRGRDVVLTPKQAGAPLNFLIYPYCEIDGKEASGGVTRKFTFKDV